MVDHLEEQFQTLGSQESHKPDYPDQDHVLIIEDDQRLAELTRDYLEANGFQVTLEADGAKGVDRILTLQPDLVILDLMLPGEDGLAICRRVRPNFAGPIMMLTARTDDLDQVLGLEMGADDYVPKPVQPRVLLARMRALLRRADGPASDGEIRLRFENLEIDNATREAWLSGERIDLTSAEFDLLWLLARNAGRVLTREEIFNDLRGSNTTGRIARSMCECHVFAPRLVMTPTSPTVSRRYVARAIYL